MRYSWLLLLVGSVLPRILPRHPGHCSGGTATEPYDECAQHGHTRLLLRGPKRLRHAAYRPHDHHRSCFVRHRYQWSGMLAVVLHTDVGMVLVQSHGRCGLRSAAHVVHFRSQSMQGSRHCHQGRSARVEQQQSHRCNLRRPDHWSADLPSPASILPATAAAWSVLTTWTDPTSRLRGTVRSCVPNSATLLRSRSPTPTAAVLCTVGRCYADPRASFCVAKRFSYCSPASCGVRGCQLAATAAAEPARPTTTAARLCSTTIADPGDSPNPRSWSEHHCLR